MNPAIPGLFFLVMIAIGMTALFVGIFKRKSAHIIIFWVIVTAVGVVMLANIPSSGPYFEDPEQEKVYLAEGTIKLNEKYATGLIEWSLLDRTSNNNEILYGSKDDPGFKMGDCVSLQNNELKTIKIQGCGNNS